MDGFSTEKLSSLNSFRQRVLYCKEMLGNPIGRGSSRIVFQIDDEKVLKLAMNPKGIAQNEVEGDWGASNNYGDSVPKLFYVDDDNYYFIITEFVLPAKPKDFEVALGISFEEFCDFVKYRYNSYCRNGRQTRTRMTDERFEELCENSEWLYDFQIYLGDYQPPFGDLVVIGNYGMTQRDGDATIVLLDSGLTDEVYNNYYSNR